MVIQGKDSCRAEKRRIVIASMLRSLNSKSSQSAGQLECLVTNRRVSKQSDKDTAGLL